MSIEDEDGKIISPRVAEAMAYAEKPYHEIFLLSKLPVIKKIKAKEGNQAAETVGREIEEKINELFKKLIAAREIMRTNGMGKLQITPFQEIEDKKTILIHPDKAERLEDYPEYKTLSPEEQQLIQDKKSYGVYYFTLTGKNKEKLTLEQIERHRVTPFLSPLKRENSLNYASSQENIDIENLNNPDLQDYLMGLTDDSTISAKLDELIEYLQKLESRRGVM